MSTGYISGIVSGINIVSRCAGVESEVEILGKQLLLIIVGLELYPDLIALRSFIIGSESSVNGKFEFKTYQ